MKFPAYVPAAVREYISHYLRHYEGIHARSDGELRERIGDDIDRLRRFADDDRMKPVYESLATQLTDRQWNAFINAAWATRLDYSPDRDNVRRGKEIAEEIANDAKKLAGTLRNFNKEIGHGDAVFFSIRALLRETEHTPNDDAYYHLWRAFKPSILGEENSPADMMVQNAWDKAPPLEAMLEALAKAAKKYEHEAYDATAREAISWRQSNPKNEYIRAFAARLKEDDIPIDDITILKAMADVVTVAINSMDDAVTYEEVKAALKPKTHKSFKADAVQ